MITSLSALIGTPIFVDSVPGGPVSLVRDVVIDPATGKLLALKCLRRRILLINDAHFFNNGIYLRSIEDLLNPTDVVRIERILKEFPTVIGLPMYVESKKNYIGRLTDLDFDPPVFSLKTLSCSKVFLFIRYGERIIAAKNIIEIKPDGIFVKDTSTMVEEVSQGETELLPA